MYTAAGVRVEGPSARRWLLACSLILLSTSITTLSRAVSGPTARTAMFVAAVLVITGGFVAIGQALRRYRADLDAGSPGTG